MPPLAGVEFLHGDFREEAVLSQFEAMLGDQPVDLVLSDMAPIRVVWVRSTSRG